MFLREPLGIPEYRYYYPGWKYQENLTSVIKKLKRGRVWKRCKSRKHRKLDDVVKCTRTVHISNSKGTKWSLRHKVRQFDFSFFFLFGTCHLIPSLTSVSDSPSIYCRMFSQKWENYYVYILHEEVVKLKTIWSQITEYNKRFLRISFQNINFIKVFFQTLYTPKRQRT